MKTIGGTWRRTLAVFGMFWVAAVAVAAEPEKLTDEDIVWRQKIGFNPQVHGSVEKSSDAEVFARVPFAYYPYSNELEVVFDAAAAAKLLPAGAPAPAGDLSRLKVSVFPAVIPPDQVEAMPFYYGPAGAGPAKTEEAVAAGTIALDAKGRGHGVIKLPDLPAGNYRVEYEFGGARLTAAKTFRRTHFEWEHCPYGTEHKVYAPFTPVQVVGKTVSVVDRTYTVNPLGLFDSVVSKGRELLAAPMKLVVETADGKRVEWKGLPGSGVEGKAVYPDLAEFQCGAGSANFDVKSQVSVEEDGCAKVSMKLSPAPSQTPPPQISKAWIEIALKDTEAPLCHMAGLNSMRHNYAGNVPRGGKITWIMQPWRPARFEVEPFAGKAPGSYEVWNARQSMQWGAHDPDQQPNFAPYVWLGAEERGLAWFGDHVGGYETDGRRGIQRLSIEPGRVVLRVELIQKPVALDAPRTFEFGLQASPTKPMRPDWRRYTVPGNGGMSVVVWGGFACADKVPANKDWTIVDKILEARGTGKADFEWFADYAKTHTTFTSEGGGAKPGVLRRIPLSEAKANGQPWLTAVSHFAGSVANAPKGVGTTVYFEEHQTNGHYPEVTEFMDEWSDGTFARYRYFDHPRTWGPEIRSANPASYRDFAVFYANEWMKRGVGIYYDNTYPQLDFNRAHFRDLGVAWTSSIWGHRDYYKRVWKRSRELMESKLSPLPLHTVGHVTNCQILPYTTWWDATLGVESPSQWKPDKPPTAAERAALLDQWGFLIIGTPKDNPGRALPYPPDYLRAMEGGRMAGLIPAYRHRLRGEDAFGGLGIAYGSTGKPSEEVEAHRNLSDVGMGLVHEIRGGMSGGPTPVGSLRRTLADFGYGPAGATDAARPDVQVHNYWEEKPFVAVGNPDVKWLAATRDGAPFGLLLLQSYSPEAVTTTVKFPGAKYLVDAETRQVLAADKAGKVSVSLPADYGTRLLYATKSASEPKLLASAPGTLLLDDFELGLGYRLGVRGESFAVVPDGKNPANHVLRITGGPPPASTLSPQSAPALKDYELSFKFRVPEIPADPSKGGLLTLNYRNANKQRFGFGLGYDTGKDGQAIWTVANPLLVLDGGKSEGYQKVVATAAPESPVDSGWHTLAIKVQGRKHVVSLDGKTVFEGEDDRNLEGGFSIAPGWGWPNNLKSVEIDDLAVKEPTVAWEASGDRRSSGTAKKRP